MRTPRIIARNVSWSWLGHFVHAATALLLTPVILDSLGATQFGIWALVTGFTGYYGLLDFGFRPGLTRFVVKYRALRDWEKLNRTASTGIAILSVCALNLWFVTFLLTYLAPWLFSTDPSLTPSLRWAIFLMGTSLSLQFPFFFQSAVFVATQRFDLANMIGITSRLIQAVAIYIVVTNGFGLVGLATVVAVTELGTYIVRSFIAAKLIPELHFSTRYINRTSLKEFVGFSFWASLSRFSHELIGTSDRYVVVVLMGTTAVTRFHLAFSLVAQLRKLFSPFPRVFFPVLADLADLKHEQQLVSLYLAGTRVITLLVVPVTLVAFIWAPDFYRLWIGAAASNGEMPTAALLMRILIVGMLVRVPQIIGYQIFHAKFQVRQLSGVMSAEALTNVFASLILGSYYGLVGVATATVISGVIFELLLLPWLLSHRLRIPIAEHFAAIWLRPVFTGVVLAPVLIGIHAFRNVDSWSILLVECGIATGIALLFAMWLGFTPAERKLFVWAPIARRLIPSKRPTR